MPTCKIDIGTHQSPKICLSGFQDNHEAILLCPNCGDDYLGHERIEVFDRWEDAKHGVHVLIENGKATMDASMEGNPSQRRHGLTIGFSCEGCGKESTLILYQHKGNTYFQFAAQKEAA
jgi:hypothetical protein